MDVRTLASLFLSLTLTTSEAPTIYFLKNIRRHNALWCKKNNNAGEYLRREKKTRVGKFDPRGRNIAAYSFAIIPKLIRLRS